MRALSLVIAALAVGLTTVGCGTQPAAPSAPPTQDAMDEGEMTGATTDPTAACEAMLTAGELSSLTGVAGFTFAPGKSDVDRAGVRLCAFDTPQPGADAEAYAASYTGTAYRGEFTVESHTFAGLPGVVPVAGLDGARWQAATNRLYVDLADRGVQVFFATDAQTADGNLADALAIARLVGTRVR